MKNEKIEYSKYCQDWHHIEKFVERNVKRGLIDVGEELFRILCYVHAPEDNPANKNKDEEPILVYLLINSAQWLQSSIGSYKTLSLTGVAAAIRGIYECHISMRFLMNLNDNERKKYVDRYDKFKYAERKRFKQRSTSAVIQAHQLIDDEYDKYAKQIFDYVNSSGKTIIRRDWTAEGWDTRTLTLKAGLNQEHYETYFTWPSQYIHNSPIIQPFYQQRLPIPDPGRGLSTLETTVCNVFVLAGELIIDYANHFSKIWPEDTIRRIIKTIENKELIENGGN